MPDLTRKDATAVAINLDSLHLLRTLTDFPMYCPDVTFHMSASVLVAGSANGVRSVECQGLAEKARPVCDHATKSGKTYPLQVILLIPVTADDISISAKIGIFAAAGGQYSTQPAEFVISVHRTNGEWRLTSAKDVVVIDNSRGVAQVRAEYPEFCHPYFEGTVFYTL